MTEFTKIAVTVPTETYAVVERLRRRLGKSRSAVVALALEEWIRSMDMSDADRRYIEGYLRFPEDIDAARAVAAQATSHWDTWSPGEPSRASDVRPRAPARRTRAGTSKRSRR
ncbi:MAG: ribbon-helix-helix protein, CopG family [Deltaproteobacteria bacterium]|nr:MAG: ribbon-helix-helix protein, CopG family [Deltaproteobacteria bacterium]TMQ20903.1 MAG: ribbon-helix-helix protein, CopG family [Deltaproteobacteria bacterium]